jgi:Flp pilus assembly protein TadG
MTMFDHNAGNANFVDDAKGVAFLEFTILFPLLLALSIGVFEFGRALQHHHVIDKAVRDTARYLARVAATCTAAGTGNGTIDSAYLTNARNLALTGVMSGGSPILNYWTDPNSVAVSVDCVDRSSVTPPYRGASFMPIINVTATVPYADLGFLMVLGLGGFTFSVDHTQLHIGE